MEAEVLVLPSVHSANDSVYSGQNCRDRLADHFAGTSAPAGSVNIYSYSKFAAKFMSKPER